MLLMQREKAAQGATTPQGKGSISPFRENG